MLRQNIAGFLAALVLMLTVIGVRGHVAQANSASATAVVAHLSVEQMDHVQGGDGNGFWQAVGVIGMGVGIAVAAICLFTLVAAAPEIGIPVAARLVAGIVGGMMMSAGGSAVCDAAGCRTN